MTIWYIDPRIAPGAETDSFVGPHGTGRLRDSWADVSWVNGNSYFGARGSTHVGGFTITGISAHTVVGAYGVGDRPKIHANGGAYAIRIGASSHVTVQDFEGIGGSTADIGRDTNASPHCTIRRCLSRNSIANVAITSFGDDCAIEDCEVYDAGNDAISFEGDRVKVLRNRILGFGLTSDQGDGISAGDALLSSNDCDVRLNYVVASRNYKQCLIFNTTTASSSGGVVSRNECIFVPASMASVAPGQCIYTDFPGMVVRENKITDGLFGVYAEASGIVIMSNEFTMTAPQAIAGVFIAAPNIRVLNNALVMTGNINDAVSTQVAIRHADPASTHTGVVIQNNAIHNFRHGISRRVANSTESHNVVNASTVARAFVDQAYLAASPGTSSVVADPMLKPNFRLRPGSPCARAGIHIPDVYHMGGIPLGPRPDIGAYRYFDLPLVASGARA